MILKKVVKRILPVSVWEYLSAQRHAFRLKKSSCSYSYYLRKIKRNTVPEEKLTIVFFASLPELWNSLKSVYEAASKDSRISVCVYVLPIWSGEKWEYATEEFYLMQNLNIYKAYHEEDNTWADLRGLHPAYVFYERPYDVLLPAQYRSDQVKKYARICYVPYGYILTDSKQLLRTVFPEDFFMNLYIFFASWKDVGEYCENFNKSRGCRDKKVVYLGYPRFDLLKAEKGSSQSNIFNIMWTPRFKMNGDLAEGYANTSFFEFKDKIVERCVGRTKENWLFRPHPLAFQSYMEQGLMTHEEIEQYKKSLENLPNASLDTCKDYLVGFRKADILVADFSSIIIEFFMTGKPIIYCGNISSLPIKELRECVYPVKNWEELEHMLDLLESGQDSLYEKRLQARDSLGISDIGSIGKNIIQYIINDYAACT